MKWLLTLSADTTSSRVRQIVQSAGSTLEAGEVGVPMDEDVVFEVDGPADLPNRLRSVPEVKAVHPSSEMTLY